MNLRLKIENVATLPDGGPLDITVTGRRGIDIGRDQHLDWTLPDASRFISGKHCEVRFHDGSFWLHDVSTNGTFVNGAEDPIRGPHRLRDGDKVEIGPYSVAVRIDVVDEPPADGVPRGARVSTDDLWHVEDVAPPAEPDRRRAALQPRMDDPFLDARFDAPRPVRDAGGNGPEFATSAPATRHAAPGLWGDEASRALPQTAERVVPPVQAAPITEEAPRPKTPTGSNDDEAVLRAFARGAGMPGAVFASHSPIDLAMLMGRLVRLSADNLKQLLAARSELKDMVRSSQTAVMASDNNPLKLAPTIDEALGMMFAPSASYLDAMSAFEQGFRDLKHHQVQTFSAMQVAVSAIGRDLEPRAIEAQVEPDRGLGAVVGSRKARLWDTYVLNWKARAGAHEDGLLGVFLEHFSQHYGRASGKRSL